MNKDAILATIISFGVGLIIAGAVFLGPTLVKQMPRISLPDLSFLTRLINTRQSPDATPTPKPASGDLTIESPLADAIEPKNETLVSGQTKPDAVVVLEGETDETVIVANNKGAYAGKVSVSEGKNTITVTSHAGGDTQVKDVTVYYTPESF